MNRSNSKRREDTQNKTTEIENYADLSAIALRCTRPEMQAFEDLRSESVAQPDWTFSVAGYIVANASAISAKRHGRRKQHLVSLIRKQIVVPLDRSCSRIQRYLIGCVVDHKRYYVSWLDQLFACSFVLDLPNLQASPHASKRAVRPTSAETPQSLMDKGFVPQAANRPSLYPPQGGYAPYISGVEASSSAPIAPYKRRLASSQKSKTRSSLDKQITQLAARLGKLTGTPPYVTGKFRTIWEELLSLYGFSETLGIIEDTWDARSELVNAEFPKITVHSVKYYASMFLEDPPTGLRLLYLARRAYAKGRGLTPRSKIKTCTSRSRKHPT